MIAPSAPVSMVNPTSVLASSSAFATRPRSTLATNDPSICVNGPRSCKLPVSNPRTEKFGSTPTSLSTSANSERSLRNCRSMLASAPGVIHPKASIFCSPFANIKSSNSKRLFSQATAPLTDPNGTLLKTMLSPAKVPLKTGCAIVPETRPSNPA